jgi:hypothetical protein
LLERVLDFLARLSDTGKSAFRWIAAGGKDAEKFATRNDVEPGCFFGKQAQDGAVRIRFDRVTNQMIQRREGGIEPVIMVKNCSGTIYIERRPESLRDLCKIDIFAVKLPVAVMK